METEKLSFEDRLIKKYPRLFYKGEDGKEICPCGAWVSEGWEGIVDNLCGAIDQYLHNVYTTKKVIISKWYYFWYGLYIIIKKLHLLMCRYIVNKASINGFVAKNINHKLLVKYSKCCRYDKQFAPSVQIDQVKEKFGGLRFYYSGGDKVVDGMVQFAEYLTTVTCEVTGQPGTLHQRGGWNKTLSPEAVKNIEWLKGYTPIRNENIN